MAVDELRWYQERDMLEVRRLFRTYRSVLLTQPTGAGKGYLASRIVKTAASRGRRISFMVNRRALVEDMSDRVKRMGLEHGVIMGDDKRYDPDRPVQVVSIDTISRRSTRPPADLIIVDEARFAVSPTWMRVLGYYPEAKILGLDATPIRNDGRGLGHLFEALVQGPSVQTLIDQNYLVPAVVFRPQGPQRREKAKGDDFTAKQLANICDKPKLVGDVVETWRKRCPDRKTAAFGVNQDHASKIAERFRCAGVDWAYVDAETRSDERQRIWNDLDYGNLRGVSSVGVISYGWDHPIISCIIAARATESVALWLQMKGRASRPYPGKTDFYVMDHFDNSGNLDVFYGDDIEWSLDQGMILKPKQRGEEETASVTQCRKCFATFRSGPVACPFCGKVIEKQHRRIATAKGDLEAAQREAKAQAIATWQSKQSDAARRAKYEEYCAIAAAKGYKKTWPAIRYNIQYGQFPPSEWRSR